jgi:hypothetical protein
MCDIWSNAPVRLRLSIDAILFFLDFYAVDIYPFRNPTAERVDLFFLPPN